MDCISGLSPHGRGKLGQVFRELVCRRSIPARAGETSGRIHHPLKRRVYPRTGGGNHNHPVSHIIISGLSPHGRGKPSASGYGSNRPRSIPARAGETLDRRVRPLLGEVYPRTGGGNRRRYNIANTTAGLSPHGRGKRAETPPGGSPPGSIPARAGETAGLEIKDHRSGVYPRTGGGNPVYHHHICCLAGLSPHGRGKPITPPLPRIWERSIPARAGETAIPRMMIPPAMVYPRTGGGNGIKSANALPITGLSPHGRGKRYPAPEPSGRSWSIPARAGETQHPGGVG